MSKELAVTAAPGCQLGYFLTPHPDSDHKRSTHLPALGPSFILPFEKAKEFTIKLEIKVPAVIEPTTGLSSIGQKGEPQRYQKITKDLKQFMTTLMGVKNFMKFGNQTATLEDEKK